MKKFSFILIILIGLLVTTCDNEKIPTSPNINQTTHGYIQNDEIWRGEIHIVGDIIVEDGVTLTIEPGTVILVSANQDMENLNNEPFDMKEGICSEDDFEHGVHEGEPYRDEGHHISIKIFGTLYAVGTPDQMITITSDSPTPDIYDWNRFTFDYGTLSYCIMDYYRILAPGIGTTVSNDTLRHIGECGVQAVTSTIIEGNTISYAGHELIDIHNHSPIIRNNHLGPNPGHVGIIIDGGSPQIVNNFIEGCVEGIAFISPPGDPTIEGNTFSDNGIDIEYDY
jgi:hypothetical protein